MQGISEFRRKKLLFVFNVFFDVNKSGTIDKRDFELAIDKVCSARGWLEGGQEYSDTSEVLLSVWEGLKMRADANHDGQVSREEWCEMWDEYAKNPGSVLEWQQRYMNFMFDLEDVSGDGSIDENEFTAICSSYGLGIDECRKAYSKLSSNKIIKVTREVFAELWQQYFASENQADPGNYIFGKLSFDD